MNLTTDRDDGVVIIRVDEPKLMYPMLSDFSESISNLVDAGDVKIVIDMTKVVYVDSASIGCLAAGFCFSGLLQSLKNLCLGAVDRLQQVQAHYGPPAWSGKEAM